MPTGPTAQNTDCTPDVLGRYVCNGLDEALRSTNRALRPDARPFDLILLGGGSFGPVLAGGKSPAKLDRPAENAVG